MFSQVRNEGTGDAGDSQYSTDPLLGVYRDLRYEDCKRIYRYWPLGKRIATALPNFALSSGRTYTIGKNEPELIEAVKQAEYEMNLIHTAFTASVFARVYGSALIYVACDEIDPEKPILSKDVRDGAKIKFNVLDCLSQQNNIQINNNPISTSFGQPTSFRIASHTAHTQRVCFVQNDLPLYLLWTQSNRSFAGPSIYQNMQLLIRAWNRCIVALQRLATKAASIVVMTKDQPAYFSALNQEALAYNLELIRSMENDGIARLPAGSEVQFFALTGVSEVDVIIQKLHSALMMALSDTPSGILLDKNLATGLNDGDNDLKAILIATKKFQETMLAPIFKFLDKFMLAKAITPEIIKLLQTEYEYKGTPAEIYEQLVQDYKFEFAPLYPQTENEEADTLGKHLENVAKLKEIGVERSSLEEVLNKYEDKIGAEIVMNEDHFEKDFNESEGEDESGESEEKSESKSSPKGIDSPSPSLGKQTEKAK